MLKVASGAPTRGGPPAFTPKARITLSSRLHHLHSIIYTTSSTKTPVDMVMVVLARIDEVTIDIRESTESFLEAPTSKYEMPASITRACLRPLILWRIPLSAALL